VTCATLAQRRLNRIPAIRSIGYDPEAMCAEVDQ
jgi:hypothetical protein